MKPSSDRRGACDGCAFFVRFVGRHYGFCTQGGEELLQRRGHYPFAPNWPLPCRHFVAGEREPVPEYPEGEGLRCGEPLRCDENGELLQEYMESVDPACWMYEQAERDAREVRRIAAENGEPVEGSQAREACRPSL